MFDPFYLMGFIDGYTGLPGVSIVVMGFAIIGFLFCLKTTITNLKGEKK